MARLIDADALDKKMWDRQYPYAQTKAQLYVRKMIKEAPTIDAVPVVHADLKETGYDEAWCSWGDCTNCLHSNIMGSKYCNKCGAKLDGGASDG